MRQLALLSILSLTACDDGGAETDDTEPDQSGLCTFHEGDVYSPGLRKDGEQGLYDVLLTDAQPDPPDRGENTFVFQVLDHSDDTPVGDVTVTVTPTMTEHNHGTSPANFTGVYQGADGSYEVGPIDLFMGGVWHIAVEVQGPTATDSVAYDLCLEG